MLGSSFGDLLGRLREVVGTENEMLNMMNRYYTFVSSNQDQLSAIAALAQGFEDLVAIGIVNASNVKDFAASFRAEFRTLIESTNNKKTALMAIGPQIGQLLEAFREMGIKVPKWLEDMALEAEKAGASMEPPEGLPDILGDIRDILRDIAGAFGVAAGEAGKFKDKVNQIPRNVTVDVDIRERGGGGGGGKKSAQGGLHIPRVHQQEFGPIYAHRGEAIAIDRPEEIARRFAQQFPQFGGSTFAPPQKAVSSIVGERVVRVELGQINVMVEGVGVVNDEQLASAIGPAVGIALRENFGEALTNAEEGLEERTT
jgi:hypothetical protein